ncbi:MAG: DNA-directed RNA polymerase subunit omega [Peptococcaceae bacterium]|jgi:DNA-directed RNA polymerase subunit omega|nr:DNA-directed RNA polymerase subunit omega [Peptococcaceae bacterium]
MRQPSLDILMSKVDSKYTLVVAASKRARALMENTDPEESKDIKPVTRALEEIALDKITIDYNREVKK